MPKVRRIAASSRVSAAKRASELEATTNIQRKRDSAVVISSARPGARCASSSVAPGNCSGSTPTCAPPRACAYPAAAPAPATGSSSAVVLERRRGRRGVGGCGRLRRGADRHAAAVGTADFRQQLLGFLRRRGVQQVGQHGAAAVVGLDRHAALAAGGMRPHQRPPGALMRPVDLQQALRRRDGRLGLARFAQQRLGDVAGTVAQALALGGQPGVEGRIDAVQVLQQVAVEQRQRGRLVGGGPHHLLHVHPDGAGAQRQVVAGDLHDLAAGGRQRLQQPVDFLPQRGARLLLRPAAPEQFGEPAAQGGARGGQRHDGQQGARLASGGQHVFAGDRPGFHLADQAQAQHHLPGGAGLRGGARGPGCRACHHRVINTVSVVSQIGSARQGL